MSFHDEIMEKVEQIAQYAGRPNIFDEDMLGAIYAHERYDAWRTRFRKFTHADPVAAQQFVTDLNEAATNMTLNNDGTLSSIDTEIHEWTGRAAENFRTYIGDVKDAVGMQCDALKSLGMIAEAHQRVIEGMRADVTRIADDTITALRTPSGGGDGGLSFMFSVLAAVAYAASAYATGGASVAWAVVAGFNSVASTATSSAAIAGQSQVEKLQAMEKALEDLREAVIQEQERIQAGLTAFKDFLSEHLLDIRPTRPTIATPMANQPGSKGWTTADFYPTPG